MSQMMQKKVMDDFGHTFPAVFKHFLSKSLLASFVSPKI